MLAVQCAFGIWACCIACAAARSCPVTPNQTTNSACHRTKQKVATTPWSLAHCPVKGLDDVISNLQLHAYASAIFTWCSQTGAAFLHEVAENIEELVQTVSFDGYERDQLLRWASCLLAKHNVEKTSTISWPHVPCPVKGLDHVISNLQLHAHAPAIFTWCSEEGAAFLHEVVDNLEDLLETLSLNEYERARLWRWASCLKMQAAQSADDCHDESEEFSCPRPGRVHWAPELVTIIEYPFDEFECDYFQIVIQAGTDMEESHPENSDDESCTVSTETARQHSHQGASECSLMLPEIVLRDLGRTCTDGHLREPETANWISPKRTRAWIDETNPSSKLKRTDSSTVSPMAVDTVPVRTIIRY